MKEIFKITGGRKLQGRIKVDGAKNSALPLMTLPILTSEKVTLNRVPLGLIDVDCMSDLLIHLGCEINEDTVEKKASYHFVNAPTTDAPYEIVKRMRASILVLGPLLARFNQAQVSLPGGCAIGARPIDRHLFAMKALGAEIDLEHGYIKAKAKSGLRGAIVRFEEQSVGATENTLLAAVLAKGETKIEGASKEPEILDLILALRKMGAIISGDGSSTLLIQGVDELKGIEHEVIPDRLEAGSLLLAAATTRGSITVENCRSDHLIALIDRLTRCGVQIVSDSNNLHLTCGNHIEPTDITTAPYPDFPTDLQAQYMAFMCTVPGISNITENVFERRFTHIPELRRLGADIDNTNRIARIRGGMLSGAPVIASDIRAGVGLMIAALAANGESTISEIHLIDRGHYRIENKLNLVGADIFRTTSHEDGYQDPELSADCG